MTVVDYPMTAAATASGDPSTSYESMPPPSSADSAQPIVSATPAVVVGAGNSPAVYGATYSGVFVYEMTCRQVAVMRRRYDSYLNATQILKVAGVDKGRRTKILEREVQVGQHEKVQGGYGKYQGTWIPFERGVEIARQYGVEELLRPLLDYEPVPGEELASAPRPKVIRRTASKPKFNDDMEDSPKYSGRRKGSVDSMAGGDYPSSFGFYSVQTGGSAGRAVPTSGERYRAILMSVFLNHESHKLPELLTNATPPADLDVDLIIDDQGHTSLHWAAALSRIPVLQLLLNLGADARRVNYNGESALIRAVLVTNNFDNDTFGELLNLLHSAIDITDKKGRTIIHHVTLTAGIKGRMQAARYYLENILDMMTKAGMDIGAIIDVQDKNGDTALNIAARIGNRNLVEILLRAGADAEIPNRAGLRAIDFGLEDARLSSLFNKDANGDTVVEPVLPVDIPAFGVAHPSAFPRHGSSNTADESTAMITNLEKENQLKESQLQEALAQIRNISNDLVEARKAVQNLSKRVADLELIKGDYEKKLGLPTSEPTSSMVSPPVAPSGSEAEREITRLRAILSAHGIPADENTSVVTPTDAKITQLIAQVLNVPVAEITPSLLDPLLTALSASDMKQGALVVQEHKNVAAASAVADGDPMEE